MNPLKLKNSMEQKYRQKLENQNILTVTQTCVLHENEAEFGEGTN